MFDAEQEKGTRQVSEINHIFKLIFEHTFLKLS